MIAIVDYGMGNLRSVEKACGRLGFEARITSHATEISSAERVILPGVGAFGDAMAELERRDLTGPVKAAALSGRPFLGICLGLQVLFDSSEEAPGIPGLGILPGTVVRFRTNLKVPHMGWNSLRIRPESRLFAGIPQGSYVYFVHSFLARPVATEVVAAECDYDGRFAAAIERGSLFATQFHPEKSQDTGLAILRNFASLAPAEPARSI